MITKKEQRVLNELELVLGLPRQERQHEPFYLDYFRRYGDAATARMVQRRNELRTEAKA
jgi:hypothetical protein